MGIKIFILFIVAQIVIPYSIKINPVLNTKVNNVKNQGDHNTIQLAQISNSTILNSIPSQVIQSHQNELMSTTAILVSFSVVFIILSITITKQALVIFKLNLRISKLEQVIYQWVQSDYLVLKQDEKNRKVTVKNIPYYLNNSPVTIIHSKVYIQS